jgi:hypothetical protein
MPPVLTEPKRWARPRDPSKPRYTSDLSPDEQANAKRALRVLRLRLGTVAALAEALSANPKTLLAAISKRGRPTAGLSLRAARLAGVPLEDMLSGAWPVAGSGPHCGSSVRARQ